MSNQLSTQPKSLSIFFLTEMWERYGFYIIQSLLILFLIQKFTLSDDDSYAILGSFTALAYTTPILGGYLADKIFGHRQAVLLGGIMLCLGYGIIAATSSLSLLSLALGVVTMGTGLLKPNISSLLGKLYSENDSRRDGGFTLFYVGINIGMLLATCLAGYLVQYIGWHNTFATASAGLVLGSFIFYWGTQYFQIKDAPITTPFRKKIAAYTLIIAAALLSAFIIQHETFALACFLTVCAATVVIVLYKAFQHQPVERNRILAYFILVLVAVLFWAFYFQVFFSLNLFVLRVVNHDLLGFTVPTPVFMGIESFGVVAFGLVLGKMWTWLKSKSYGPSTSMKFTLGMGFITLSFGVLLLSIHVTASNVLIASNWLILAYLLIALAELSLSPIGLSMVTELVPDSMVGMMMGIWFVSTGIGGKLAGLFADYSAVPDNLQNVGAIEQIYHHAFMVYFVISLLATMLVLALNPFVKRLSQRNE